MVKKTLLILSFTLVVGNLFSQWIQVGQGANAQVNDLIVYNNSLVAGGQFANIGGGIANWDGSNWTAFGQGVDSGGIVYCLDTLNSNLYAGGSFTMIDGVPANNIAVWNGSNWSALGGGTNGTVICIAFFAGELYVGGQFTMAGSVPANNVAKWDGTNWSALGSGLISGYSFVHSLCVYNNELYAGGLFNAQGNNNIAKWTGSTWSALGSGADDQVNSLKVFNNELYVGGDFHYVNSTLSKFIAKWNGAWSSVIPNSLLVVRSMSVFNGNLFLVGAGSAGNSLALWDGVNWLYIYTGIIAPPCAFIPHGIYAVEKFNNDIYLGGFFTQGCGEPGDCIVYANQSVGTGEHSKENEIEVYPNPVTTNATFKFSEFEENKTLIIYDQLGKEIWRKETTENQIEFSVEGFSSGLYFYQVEQDGKTVAGKFIIQ